MFLVQYKVHSKIEGKVQRFPIHPCPQTFIASPNTNISQQCGTFVIIDEPTLTHHNYPKSIVYIRVHSWCCTFYGFRQIYNDMYQLL